MSLGFALGLKVPGGSVISLQGELGSGKTVFVKGLAQGLGIDPAKVRSPTFAIVQEHDGKKMLCHVDLYRVSPRELSDLGLEEHWKPDSGWVTAIEWGEKAEHLVPDSTLKIQFEQISPAARKLVFSGDKKWKKILNALKQKK